MRGQLFAIVGPSGVGKDTLMAAAKAKMPTLHLVRRVITRPSEAGGEPFEGVSETEFSRRLEQGEFVLHWPAHGLRYGIPTHVRDVLAQGRPALFNGSRAMLKDALTQFPALRIIHVTARPDVLAKRLAERGRETKDDIARRLERAAMGLPDRINAIEIDNSDDLGDAVQALLAVLQPESA